jgi:integrase/recombinase XerD
MNLVTLANRYITEKRQLGYKLTYEAHCILEFSRYFQDREASLELNTELTLQWASLAPSGSSIAIARRFGILRPFSQYLHQHGFTPFVLPSHYLGPTHRRLPPYIYSEEEIKRLMTAASNLIPIDGLRPLTIRTLIGLLISTGIRPGEAVRLQCNDVDLHENVLTISNSKGWYQRMVPLSTSTANELSKYRLQRIQANPLNSTNAFFEFDNQQALNIRSADHAFKVLREATGILNSLNGRLPRLYDLRHTFVCQRVLTWYKNDEDINTKVTQLSRYLGHKKVSDTYWYITAIPDLMSIAADKFAKYSNKGGVL